MFIYELSRIQYFLCLFTAPFLLDFFHLSVCIPPILISEAFSEGYPNLCWCVLFAEVLNVVVVLEFIVSKVTNWCTQYGYTQKTDICLHFSLLIFVNRLLTVMVEMFISPWLLMKQLILSVHASCCSVFLFS